MSDIINQNINPITIEDEMKGSYLDYAMSVIVGRALPDVRDGLKPVHRRILYAMLREGLLSNKKFSKCAGVVGEVLKSFHPHGDSAVYDALVRLAQGWSMRYPLIDGQGNFGSVDGDPAAAYRYTECRMQNLAESLLADIDKGTVDFVPNFDESTEEPLVLPSRVPNLLINGAEGIAVGMASKIPPHNLGEVVRAVIRQIENPDVSVEDLMEVLPGPDFPTGGIIYGASPIRQIYKTGRGTIKIRAKLRVETLSGSRKDVQAIVVDELPYQVNKARLIEKVAELVNEKKITGISKIRDESDRTGMRIVFELKRDAVSDVVINQLFLNTFLQRSFGVIMLAIVDGVPKELPLKSMLQCFIDHRRTVVVRRTRFDLDKARARLHILEGFKIALDNIDEIIKTIRASETTADAKAALIERFSLSEIQAQSILDMPLRRLTGLERQALEDEYKEVLETIAGLEKILSSTSEVDTVIVSELNDILEKFNDSRRTEIDFGEGDDIDLEDLIAEEDMVVSISHRGYAKRCSPTLYRAQKRGGKGVQGTKKLAAEADEDFVTDLFVASTHAYLLVFTSTGKLYWIKVYNLPEGGRTARGRAIVNMLNLDKEERVSAVLPVRNFEEGRFIVLVSKKGVIKRLDLMAASNPRKSGIIATSLDDGDELIGVRLTDGKSDIVITTSNGLSIRFSESDVRAMGRTARGVRAINLEDGDRVVSITSVLSDSEVERKEGVTAQGTSGEGAGSDSDTALLSVCEKGYGKRTDINEYRRQGRGGKGLLDIKTNDRNGPVVGSVLVRPTDDVMLVTTSGKIIRMNAGGISQVGRNTMGVRLVSLDEGERVVVVAYLADMGEDEGEEEKAPDGKLFQ
ncbi:MAG TPA: DNA gyrase subunit A [Oligoflexia bacterium]|nr:DNA gyrase subunit A [Oligoflexia bacterium]HMP48125.1 DNA gyrase subunit A [Oligoflexia bacterium]